jgi:hypothetical protein
MPKASKPPPTNVVSITNINPFDPENVNKRLYMQVSALLGQLEQRDSHNKVTMRERIAALIAIGRIQQLFIAMRKASGDVGSGATVKKYATAFTDAASRRAANARRDAKRDIAASEPEPEDWFESDSDEPDDAAE